MNGELLICFLSDKRDKIRQLASSVLQKVRAERSLGLEQQPVERPGADRFLQREEEKEENDRDLSRWRNDSGLYWPPGSPALNPLKCLTLGGHYPAQIWGLEKYRSVLEVGNHGGRGKAPPLSPIWL